MAVEISGMGRILARFDRVTDALLGDVEKGLRAAGFFIEGASAGRVPVDTGTLKSSKFSDTEIRSSDKSVVLRVGYRAFYAPYVHENLEVSHTSGEAKFLERPIQENRRTILELVRNHARLPQG